MWTVLARRKGVMPDYAVAVDAVTLSVPDVLRGEIRLLVAATVGPVRLIDNVGTTLAPADAPVAASRRRATRVAVA
jgi:pantothenate synthetase